MHLSSDGDKTALTTCILLSHFLQSGKSFFDSWWFWSYDDPTHGTVKYQTKEAAVR